jgi:hypothetical protein
MLYVQQFQNTRQNQLKRYQRFRSVIDKNFLICSNEYAKRVPQPSQSIARTTTSGPSRERTRALLIVTRIPSIMSLHSNKNTDLSILNIVSRETENASFSK